MEKINHFMDNKNQVGSADYPRNIFLEDKMVNQIIPLRPGLALSITETGAGDFGGLRFKIEDAPVIFGLLLAGSNMCVYEQGPLKNHSCLYKPGCNGFSYLPKTAGRMEAKANETLLRLSLMVSTDFLENYLELETKTMPPEFLSILRNNGSPLKWMGLKTNDKLKLARQIMHNSYTGMVRTLFLESRALELIALQINEYLNGALSRPKRVPVIKKADIGRLEEARSILIKDLCCPPGLSELARRSGLNEKKLKFGFRQIYGCSVFEYFRNYRLEAARKMLDNDEHNVTEVAYQIGYLNLSHFSRAFKSRYGDTPKNYQLNKLRG